MTPERYILRNAYKAICVKWSSCMTRGQTVRRVCLYDCSKRIYILQYRDIWLKINTVKHKLERSCCVWPEACWSVRRCSVRLHATWKWKEKKIDINQHIKVSLAQRSFQPEVSRQLHKASQWFSPDVTRKHSELLLFVQAGKRQENQGTEQRQPKLGSGNCIFPAPRVEKGWLTALQTLDNLKNKAKASVNTSDSDGNQVFSTSRCGL